MSGSSRVAAQISPSERSTSFPTETKPAKPVPRAFPRDISAPIMLPLWEAAKMRPSGKSFSSKAAFAVSMTRVRKSTTPRLDRPDRGLRGRHDIGVLGRLGQRRERRPGALAEHGVAPRIDGVDAAGIADAPEKFQ